MGRALIVVVTIAAALCPLAGPASGAQPCAKLKRQHRKLPARCVPHRAAPAPGLPPYFPPALPGTAVPPRGAPPWWFTAPAQFTTSGDALWVGAHRSGEVYRVDPNTNDVVATVKIPGVAASSLAATDDSVWVGRCKFGDAGLVRISPATNRVVATVPGPAACGLAVDGAGVWATDSPRASIWRIDPSTNAVAAKISLPRGAAPIALTTTPGSVWIVDVANGAVLRLDEATGAVVARVSVGAAHGSSLADYAGAETITAGGGMVWVGNDVDDKLYRIDPQTNAVTAFDIGAVDRGSWRTLDLAFGAGSVWARTASCEAARVDAGTGAVLERIATCSGNDATGGLGFGFGSLWIAYADTGVVRRFEP